MKRLLLVSFFLLKWCSHQVLETLAFDNAELLI